VYNIGSKFDGGTCAYKNCQPSGGLVIREATAEVVSRGCRHSKSHRVPQAAGHGGFRYGGIWL